jgi:hypothetical protein
LSDIILDKIDSDDSPGLKFEPNNINGGGSGAIGILGTVKAAKMVFNTPSIESIESLPIFSSIFVVSIIF